MKLTPSQARNLLVQAKEDSIYEGPLHENDDALAISEAEKIAELAQNAWDQMVRGPEVEHILRLANEEWPEDPTPEDEASHPEFGDEPQETTSELKVPDEEPRETKDLVSEEPWPGYDSEQIATLLKDITKRANDLEDDPEGLADLFDRVWTYESAHKNRGTILGRVMKLGERLLDQTQEETNETEPEGKNLEEKSQEEVPQEEPSSERSESSEAGDSERSGDNGAGIDGAGSSDDLAGGQLLASTDAQSEPVGEAEAQSDEAGSESDDREEIAENKRDVNDFAGRHVDILNDVETSLAEERSHIPEPPQDEIPELPWDWTKLSDDELQRLYSTFSYLAYHKGYMLTKYERLALEHKRAGDEIAGEILRILPKYDEKGKSRTVTILESEAESDERVRNWRHPQHKYEALAQIARRERDGYFKLTEALSRLETMRMNEFQRSGQKLGVNNRIGPIK